MPQPDRSSEKPRFGKFAPVLAMNRGVGIDTLEGQLTLQPHCARTFSGVHTRIATRLVAMVAAIWSN